jgi:hypothetical protein
LMAKLKKRKRAASPRLMRTSVPARSDDSGDIY